MNKFIAALGVVIERIAMLFMRTPDEQQTQREVDIEKEEDKKKKDWDAQYRKYLKWRRKE